MKIIDSHQHLSSDPGDLEQIVETARGHGVVKICISACGEQFNQPGNDAVKAAHERYPDLIVPLGYVRLGLDTPDLVDELHAQGFPGLKVINPKANYSDKAYYPIYERAETHAMFILFHTGMVARMPRDKEFDTASERMRPIFLDAIARAFPALTLIAAHLGGPWYDEALWVIGRNRNVYGDLIGPHKLLAGKSPHYFESLTGLDRARGKFLFGTDRDLLPRVIEQTKVLLEDFGCSQEEAVKAFYGNMAGILGD
ncbi:MAG: amidohydrolase family protein [Kiritimatiellae bacterium]|nr:amidohydrolase family protein [Kiritimatiellia bacterium]